MRVFVIHVGGGGKSKESGSTRRGQTAADGLAELLRVLSWSEWPLRAGSGAAQGGLSALQPQH